MRCGWLALIFSGLIGAAAQAGEAVDDAAGALSVFAPGHVPDDPEVRLWIEQIGALGGAEELPLLRELVRSEGAGVRRSAQAAEREIRQRIATSQRQHYLASLPSEAALASPTERWVHRGLEPAQAGCAAYAEAVLGQDPDPELRRTTSAPTLEKMARALADRGELQLAVRLHAAGASRGHEPSFLVLQELGVDPERLLLGLIATGQAPDLSAWTILSRRGERLTVEVLGERIRGRSLTHQISAVNALGDMLVVENRVRPLHSSEATRARQLLLDAAATAPSALKPAVTRALSAGAP